jgi:hypothetical protein
MSDTQKFSMSAYNDAVEYLKSIGQYERYSNSSENDGFSIIYAANYQFQKREATAIRPMKECGK